jgi:hypothetical protein
VIVLIGIFLQAYARFESLFVVPDLDLRLRQSSGGESEIHLNNCREKISTNNELRKLPIFLCPSSCFTGFRSPPAQFTQGQIKTFRGFTLNARNDSRQIHIVGAIELFHPRIIQLIPGLFWSRASENIRVDNLPGCIQVLKSGSLARESSRASGRTQWIRIWKGDQPALK